MVLPSSTEGNLGLALTAPTWWAIWSLSDQEGRVAPRLHYKAAWPPLLAQAAVPLPSFDCFVETWLRVSPSALVCGLTLILGFSLLASFLPIHSTLVVQACSCVRLSPACSPGTHSGCESPGLSCSTVCMQLSQAQSPALPLQLFPGVFPSLVLGEPLGA